MRPANHLAPGKPGIPARWTSSAKTGVGTTLRNESRVWFTLSHGIFTEIYYPYIDQACVRDMGLIVADGADFFSEEKRDAGHKVEWLADGVPGFWLVTRRASHLISPDALPLVWVPEYLKLRRSLHDGRLFNLPPQTAQRYLKGKPVFPRLTWGLTTSCGRGQPEKSCASS